MNKFENNMDSTSIRLYIDEIKASQDQKGEHWMYIGVLAVRDVRHPEIMEYLNAGDSDYVLHFDDLRTKIASSPKLQMAERWLHYIAADNSPVCFKVLGVSMDRLNKECFGDERVESRAYHRFLRTAITGLINGVFHNKKYGDIQVLGMSHDRTHHAQHWKTFPLLKIQEGHSRISFICDKIDFINSDHRSDDGHPEHSRLLQLIDLILGTFRYVLDAPVYKNNKGAEYLASKFHDFIGELNHSGKQYKHKNRCSLSYFPKNSLSLDELLFSNERWKNHFFDSKELLWNSHGMVQEELF